MSVIEEQGENMRRERGSRWHQAAEQLGGDLLFSLLLAIY